MSKMRLCACAPDSFTLWSLVRVRKGGVFSSLHLKNNDNTLLSSTSTFLSHVRSLTGFMCMHHMDKNKSSIVGFVVLHFTFHE